MNKTNLSGALALMLVITIAAWCGEPVNGPEIVEKKLIEYGWDVPTPDYIRANIREMEKKPFDGLVFKLKGGGTVLDPKPMDAAQFAEDYENVSNIPWETFTINLSSCGRHRTGLVQR